MTWVKIDDGFFSHPKAITAGKNGRALFLAGLCYASAGLTDGRIDKAALPLLLVQADVPRATVKALVEIGWWDDYGDHWQIHQFLGYQQAASDVIARRERERAKKARQRRSIDGTYTTSPAMSPGDNPRDAPGESPPSRPVPSRPLTTQVSSPTGRDATPSPVDNYDDTSSSPPTEPPTAHQVALARAARLGRPKPTAGWLRVTAASLDTARLARLTAAGVTDPAELDQLLDTPPTPAELVGRRPDPQSPAPTQAARCPYGCGTRLDGSPHDPDCEAAPRTVTP